MSIISVVDQQVNTAEFVLKGDGLRRWEIAANFEEFLDGDLLASFEAILDVDLMLVVLFDFEVGYGETRRKHGGLERTAPSDSLLRVESTLQL